MTRGASRLDAQPDLFGVPAYRPGPEKMRSRLHKILAEAQAASHDAPATILAEVLAIEEDIAARAKRLQAMLNRGEP